MRAGPGPRVLRSACAVLAVVLAGGWPALSRADDDLALVLSVMETAAEVDVPLEVQLSLQGPQVRRVVAATPGLVDGGTVLAASPDRFVLRLTVRPERPGPLVLGPYALEAFGRRLVSNTLTLDVRPPAPHAVTVTVRPARIAIGADATLVVEGPAIAVSGVELAPSDAFTVVSRSTSTRIVTVAGTTTSTGTKTLVIRPARKGLLRFDRGALTGLREGATVRGASLDVR